MAQTLTFNEWCAKVGDITGKPVEREGYAEVQYDDGVSPEDYAAQLHLINEMTTRDALAAAIELIDRAYPDRDAHPFENAVAEHLSRMIEQRGGEHFDTAAKTLCDVCDIMIFG